MGQRKGFRHSDATKAQMSKTRKERGIRPPSPAGKPKSLETRIKLSEAQKARYTHPKGIRKRRLRIKPVLRSQVLEIHGWICKLCDLPIDSTLHYTHGMALTIDHIQPVAMGGTDDIDNLQPAHRSCNRLKGGRIDDATG